MAQLRIYTGAARNSRSGPNAVILRDEIRLCEFVSCGIPRTTVF